MANEDRQSEQFIREVDEEYRRAQLKQVWDRFAPIIIGACVAVILVTAGYRGYLWWQAREAAREGDIYLTATEQLETDAEAAKAALAQIADEASDGYALLARLRLAEANADAGDNAAAIAAFDALAADGGLDQPVRSLARIRSALLSLDSGDAEGAKTRAEPLVEAGNPWRHLAREIIGTADYQSGDLAGARESFLAIQDDAEAPADLRARSNLMVGLIDGQIAADAPASAAPADSPAAQAPDNAAGQTTSPQQ
jgi:hypothetical protein